MKWRETELLKRLKIINAINKGKEVVKIVNKGEEVIKIMRWVSVKAHYPPDGVCVWASSLYVGPKDTDRDEYKMYIMKHIDGFWFKDVTGEELDCQYEIITHWMSLPENPRNNSLSDVQKLEKGTFNGE
ncbi:hypothetical protein LCGC14_2623020 [marine sediment metagenome]|uniref:DUF551 domain-containing protein n=1 Tax=marine sediment metagenome TaxID=412755 RepID=A0A0F9CV55_9ZZZZ